MGAVDEIRAAIDKLTTVKNEPIVTALFTAEISHAEWFSRTSKRLVIFHRTIDAQLAILGDGLIQARCVESAPDYWYLPPSGQTLALARAINGVTP